MKNGVIIRIMQYMKPYFAKVMLVILCAAISVLMSLIAPILIGDAIDVMVGTQNVDMQTVVLKITQIAVVVVLSALTSYIMTYISNKVIYKVVVNLRHEMFARLQKVPLKFLDTHAHGDLTSRMINDVDQLSIGLLQGFTQFFTAITTIVGTLVLMLFVNQTLTLIVVLITPLSFVVTWVIAKKSYKLQREQMALRGEINGYTEEVIGNSQVVKSFAYEKRSQKKFEEMNARLQKNGVSAQFVSSIANPCTRFVNVLVYIGSGVAGALFVINGGLSVGQLSTFLLYANQYTRPFNEISGVVSELQATMASAKRVFDTIDEKEETADKQTATDKKQTDGKVSLHKVSFSYSKEVELIKDLSLSVIKGQKVAIVGPTGSGKSTLINLLMRFYDVDSGNIEIDSTDVFDIKRDSLRKLFGMVLQETWLKTGSVAQNIAFGKPDATFSEIESAAKAAGAHSFIRKLPNKYDTIIKEDGGISAGQKQLICIARAMLLRPSMLILDEATSSIDTLTEQKINRALDDMSVGKTGFVVAHRLSTIREADIILVMDNGKIVEQGNHEQLLAKGGFYANLWNSRAELQQ